MEQMIEFFMNLIDKHGMVVTFLSISMATNVYLFRLFLASNKLYVGVLVDNIKITEQINAIMPKLKTNSGIEGNSDSKPKEIGK